MELTKEYFDQKFATFVTKEDLKKFATKDDIKKLPTKQDVKDIVKSIVEREVGELATMTKSGFDDVMERFDKVNERFDEVNDRLDQVDVRGRVRILETDMRKIKTAIHLK